MFSFIFVWKKRSTGAVLLARYFLQMKTLKRFLLKSASEKMVYKFRLVIDIGSAIPGVVNSSRVSRAIIGTVLAAMCRSNKCTIAIGSSEDDICRLITNQQSSCHACRQAGAGRDVDGVRAGIQLLIRKQGLSPAAPAAHNNDSKCRQVTSWWPAWDFSVLS